MSNQKNSAVRWIVLAALVLTWAMTFFSRFVWSPVLSTAATDIGMTMAEAGSLMSAFYFGYLFTQIPGGWMADKFKPKYWMIAFLALTAAGTFALSLVQDYTAAYAIRFITGFLGGPIFALASRILSDYFEPRERGVAFGALLASPSIGTLIANQVGPRVLTASWGGWRATFQVAALLVLIVAIVDLFLVRNPEEVPSTQGKPTLIEGFKNYFSNKQLVITSLGGFLFMAIPAGFSTWANKFMTGAAPAGVGITATQAGTVMTLYAIFSILGSLLSGVVGKKFKINPKWFIIFIYAGACLSILFFGSRSSYTGLIIAGIIFALFSCSSSTQITTWAVNIGGSRFSGSTTALQNLLFQSSNVIFPTIAGALIDNATVEGVVQSYSSVWYLYAGLLAAGIIAMLFTSAKSARDSMK
ncbi:MAG: MFS transporter [Clostridia bacterium]|nr:MFS transporter [Clostridia bacterium]